jgi:hypothetical protein
VRHHLQHRAGLLDLDQRPYQQVQRQPRVRLVAHGGTGADRRHREPPGVIARDADLGAVARLDLLDGQARREPPQRREPGVGGVRDRPRAAAAPVLPGHQPPLDPPAALTPGQRDHEEHHTEHARDAERQDAVPRDREHGDDRGLDQQQLDDVHRAEVTRAAARGQGGRRGTAGPLVADPRPRTDVYR